MQGGESIAHGRDTDTPKARACGSPDRVKQPSAGKVKAQLGELRDVVTARTCSASTPGVEDGLSLARRLSEYAASREHRIITIAVTGLSARSIGGLHSKRAFRPA